MKMIGLARLGRDAEVRRTPGGDAVCNLSLAYVCGRKKEGEQYAPSQWIDAALWGNQAEALAPYLTKGSVHCFVLSDVHTEEYDGNDGYVKTKLVGRVDSVELGPRAGGNDNGGGQGASASGQRRQAGGQQPAGGQRQAAQRKDNGFEDMDDDIPF
jgi:single-strand DNA-binding protein